MGINPQLRPSVQTLSSDPVTNFSPTKRNGIDVALKVAKGEQVLKSKPKIDLVAAEAVVGVSGCVGEGGNGGFEWKRLRAWRSALWQNPEGRFLRFV